MHPVDNGGGNRIHWLYRTLSEHVDVDLVTLGRRSQGSDLVELGPGYRELRVARSDAQEAADLALQSEAHAPVFDIAALANIALTPAYLTVLDNSLAGSSFAILAHPYMLNALRRVGYAGPFIHESQNVEYDLKRRMLASGGGNEALLEQVREAEEHCCRAARLVYACCEEDAAGLAQSYAVGRKDVIVIPNGTDTRSIAYRGAEERRRVRRRLGLDDRPVALFLGSGHRPNLEAAERIFAVAARMPEVEFVFVGNMAGALPGRTFTPNVRLVGFVSDEERNIWLEVASVALNPMLYGGGTNLKLLDYFAAGTPVISSEIGVRGIGAVHGRHLIVAPVDDLQDAIAAAIAGGPAIEAMTRAARELVEREYDWRKLGERLHREIVARGLL